MIILGLGTYLRRERERRGLSQQQLADLCTVSLSTIQRVEADNRCSPGTFQEMARGLGESGERIIEDAKALHGSEVVPPAISATTRPQIRLEEIVDLRGLVQYLPASAIEFYGPECTDEEMDEWFDFVRAMEALCEDFGPAIGRAIREGRIIRSMLQCVHTWRAKGNTLFLGRFDPGDGRGAMLMAAAEAVNALGIHEPTDGPRFILCDAPTR